MATSQNTPVLIGGMFSTSIKTAHISKMTKISKTAGLSLSGMLNRAVENWLEIEGPVYLDRAKRKA